jgi:hypothetical protein
MAAGFAIAVGVPAMPTPRSPWLIVAFLGAIFFLSVHPLWNFWWVEKRRWRQIAACSIMLALLIGFGRLLWPLPVKPEFHIVEQIPEVRTEGNVTVIQAYITFENDGDAATFRMSTTNVWMPGVPNVIDPEIVKNLRAKAKEGPMSVPVTVPPHEQHGFASRGLSLNQNERKAFQADQFFLYYAGVIVATNDGGETKVPYCGMLQQSGTILDCPDGN